MQLSLEDQRLKQLLIINLSNQHTSEAHSRPISCAIGSDIQADLKPQCNKYLQIINTNDPKPLPEVSRSTTNRTKVKGHRMHNYRLVKGGGKEREASCLPNGHRVSMILLPRRFIRIVYLYNSLLRLSLSPLFQQRNTIATEPQFSMHCLCRIIIIVLEMHPSIRDRVHRFYESIL